MAGFEISGWLYPGETALCVDIRARVDRRVFLGTYGLDRPDTQAAFGTGLSALRTGFIQRVQVWRGARELTEMDAERMAREDQRVRQRGRMDEDSLRKLDEELRRSSGDGA